MLNRKFLLVLLFLAFIAGVGSYLQFNKPHRDVVEEEASVQMSAQKLIAAFQDNESNANAIYLDQIIQVKGTVVDLLIENSSITLVLEDEFDGLTANFDSSYISNQPTISHVTVGTDVEIKGVCNGYIMLQGVGLNHCSLVENN